MEAINNVKQWSEHTMKSKVIRIILMILAISLLIAFSAVLHLENFEKQKYVQRAIPNMFELVSTNPEMILAFYNETPSDQSITCVGIQMDYFENIFFQSKLSEYKTAYNQVLNMVADDCTNIVFKMNTISER